VAEGSAEAERNLLILKICYSFLAACCWHHIHVNPSNVFINFLANMAKLPKKCSYTRFSTLQLHHSHVRGKYHVSLFLTFSIQWIQHGRHTFLCEVTAEHLPFIYRFWNVNGNFCMVLYVVFFWFILFLHKWLIYNIGTCDKTWDLLKFITLFEIYFQCSVFLTKYKAEILYDYAV
jgi:hypothetical protein